MQNSNFDFEKNISNAHDEALKKRGIANILIAGKTGVGKSTLINTVFQGRMAATGQGKPVTQSTRKITKEGIPISIYDTKGLEVKDYNPILEELMRFIKITNDSADPQQHIHVAWICIAEGARRVEDGSLGIPVEATRCSVSLMPVASLKMPDPPECVGRNASHPTTHSSGA